MAGFRWTQKVAGFEFWLTATLSVVGIADPMSDPIAFISAIHLLSTFPNAITHLDFLIL